MGRTKEDGVANKSLSTKSSLRSQSSQVSKGKKSAKSHTSQLGKEKDSGARASSSNNRFISPEARAKYQSLASRKFTFERGIKVEDMEQTGLMDVLVKRKWVKLASTPPKSCENLVREFYANFLPDPYLNGKGTMVRGIDVVINPTLINQYLKVPEIANHVDYTVEHLPKDQMARDLYGSEDADEIVETKHFLYQKFTVEFAFWCTFASHNLMPSKHFAKIKVPRVRLVHAIGTNRPINVGKCIFQAIYDAGTATRYGLPFPSLITQFCLKAGVPTEPEDLWVASPKPIDGLTYDTLRARIMHGSNPVPERKGQQRRPDNTASSSADKTEQPAWVSEIMGAIHGLQERQEQAMHTLQEQVTRQGESLAQVTQLLLEAKNSSQQTRGSEGR